MLKGRSIPILTIAALRCCRRSLGASPRGRLYPATAPVLAQMFWWPTSRPLRLYRSHRCPWTDLAPLEFSEKCLCRATGALYGGDRYSAPPMWRSIPLSSGTISAPRVFGWSMTAAGDQPACWSTSRSAAAWCRASLPRRMSNASASDDGQLENGTLLDCLVPTAS